MRDDIIYYHCRHNLTRAGYDVSCIPARHRVRPLGLYTTPRRQLLEVMRPGTRPPDDHLCCNCLACGGPVATWSAFTAIESYCQRVRVHPLNDIVSTVHLEYHQWRAILHCGFRYVSVRTSQRFNTAPDMTS